MTLTDASDHRLIGWNGLTIRLPKSWECIVSGPCHLLVELNFQPVFELRWEKKGSRTAADLLSTVLQGLTRQTENPVCRVSPPEEFKTLALKTGAAALSWETGKRLTGLLWQCATCNSAIFCHLHHHPDVQSVQMALVLESLGCHSQQNAPAFWSIQDFQLVLPPTVSLDSYTLAPGLSRLTFHHEHLVLHYLRLAPASERLKSTSLPQLLKTLHTELAPGEILTDSFDMFECRNCPSQSQQILSRLRRQKPFYWGRIWHYEKQNRLLALTAESLRPIDLDTVHSLCTDYEIIPFPFTAGTVSQQS